MDNKLVKNYMREDMLPHIWCSGCGNGILMRNIAMAIEQNGLDKNKVCIVSGIGCSSRAAGYMDFNTIHTTHGRAIPVAIGMKLANDDLEVIVITGDGDATAIGGNHFIHGARRNIKMTVIIFNNNIYGMTGGQYSPTTPSMEYGGTAPYGNVDQSFDLVKLAVASGSTFVARGTAYHVDKTTELIRRGILHRGFTVIDCISTCPTYYGRKNRKGNAAQMLRWQKDNCIDAKVAENMTAEELDGKLVIGEFHHDNRPNYATQYKMLVEKYREDE